VHSGYTAHDIFPPIPPGKYADDEVMVLVMRQHYRRVEHKGRPYIVLVKDIVKINRVRDLPPHVIASFAMERIILLKIQVKYGPEPRQIPGRLHLPGRSSVISLACFAWAGSFLRRIQKGSADIPVEIKASGINAAGSGNMLIFRLGSRLVLLGLR